MMVSALEKIVKFVKVSPVLQATALGICTPITAFTMHNAFEKFAQRDVTSGSANAAIATIYFGLAWFAEYRSLGFMKQYSKLKNALEQYGWNESFIEKKSHTWCQRNMAQIASDDAGFGAETRDYLQRRGYTRYSFFNA